MLILEEYEHAKARGAKIYAEFVGYGNTCDAYHVTAPDPETAGGTRAFKLAFDEAELKDDEKLYINAHGTSTPLNDKGETKAIKNVLGEYVHKDFKLLDVLDKGIIYIHGKLPESSTKSMTGHMLGATGAVEAIASVLAIKEGVVPPTIHLEEPDELCDLNYVPNKAVKENIDVAASSTLGFGGHNAVVVFRKID